MKSKYLAAMFAAIVILAGGVRAEAGGLNNLGRCLGFGWSDGYHAYNNCAPCQTGWHGHHHAQQPNVFAELFATPQIEYAPPEPTPAYAPAPGAQPMPFYNAR